MNVLDCFPRPFITYPNCENKKGFCGLDITSLPGVSFMKVSAIAEGETLRAEELFERLEGEAIIQTLDDFLYEMSEQNIQLRSVVDTIYQGAFGEQFREEDGLYYGFEVERCNRDKLLGSRIQYLSIKLPKIKPTKKTIFIDNGGTIEELEVVLKTGINKIPLDLDSYQDTVKVYLNFCDLPINLPNHKSSLCCKIDNCSCMSCCNSNYRIHSIYGKDTTAGVCDSVSWEGFCPPFMQICVDVICSLDSLFCAYKRDLAQAIRYRFAALIMEETKASTRKNPLVRNTKDQAERIYVQMMGGEYESGGKEDNPKYWQALENAVKRIAYNVKSSGSACVSCEGTKILNSIP